MKGATLAFFRPNSMPASASPPTRKGFDYTGLDTETSQFVQQQTGEIRVLMKRTAQGIVEVGQKLIDVKEKLGHGCFLTWLEAEFEWSESAATKFMQVGRQFKAVKFTSLDVAPSALYILAAPSTPEIVREEALARATAGEPITYSTAKAIKQKYAVSPTKPKSKPEPELEVELLSQLQPTPTPEPLPQPGSKLEIVALYRQTQEKALPESNLSQAAKVPQIILPAQPVHAPEKLGSWWQLSERHLLYCGDPNSSEFLGRIKQKVKLLLAFSPVPGWLPLIQANTSIISSEYLPQGRNLDQLDENLESSVLFHSNLGDLVVSCFLPSPEILSIVNRLDRRGLFAEPDARRVTAVISDWKRAGLKAERLS